jgi:hypothetical protein
MIMPMTFMRNVLIIGDPMHVALSALGNTEQVVLLEINLRETGHLAEDPLIPVERVLHSPGLGLKWRGYRNLWVNIRALSNNPLG